jgi:hypothetical protein
MGREAERVEAGEAQSTQAAATAAAVAPTAAFALTLQRRAGNHATAKALRAVIARQTVTSTSQSRIDDVLSSGDPARVNGLYDDVWEATDDQRRGLVYLMLSKTTWNAYDASTVTRIWHSYGDSLAREMALQGPVFVECQRKGAVLSRLLLSEELLLDEYKRPGVLTSHQVTRAKRFLNALPSGTFGLFRWALYQAESDLEKAFIFKALAAGRSVDHVLLFAGIIRGKGEGWLMRWLNVTSAAAASVAGGSGTGIQQQFATSCGPTSVQTVRAENDPLYALWMHQGGQIYGVATGNQRMTQQQLTLLTGAGGVGVARPGSGGQGAWMETASGGFSSLSGITGVTYSRVNVSPVDPTNATGGSVDNALKVIEAALDRGIQVPIIIGDTPTATAHYVVMLMRQGTMFIVHDPWNGVTVRRTRGQFMSNSINLAGHSYLTAYSNPTEAP